MLKMCISVSIHRYEIRLLGKVTFKSNALQYYVTPQKIN